MRPDGTVSVSYMHPHNRCPQGLEAAWASISRAAEKKAKRRQRSQERKVATSAVGTDRPRPSQQALVPASLPPVRVSGTSH